jgi:hypothetical protein
MGGANISSAETPGRLHFVLWRLIYVRTQYGTCFVSPFWLLKFRGAPQIFGKFVLPWKKLLRIVTVLNFGAFCYLFFWLLCTVLKVDVQLYCCTVVLVYWCTVVLVYFCTVVLVYFCSVVLLYWCTVVPVYFCGVVLLYWCTFVLLYCCIGVLVYCCIVVLVYCCTVLPLYWCTVLLLYCFTVVLF